MIRTLRYLFLAALAVVLITIALANRDTVTLQLLPANLAAFAGAQWQITLPLYVVIFGGIVAGILIGFVWEWLREHKHRAEATRKAGEVRQLRTEMSKMKGTTEKGEPDEVLAILDRAS